MKYHNIFNFDIVCHPTSVSGVRGSWVHNLQFYVLGERVFYAVKRSMPNPEILLQNSVKSDSGPILFDR